MMPCRSAYFLAIVTKNYFQRPFCRIELDEAFKANKPVVFLQETDSRFSKWDWTAWSESAEYKTVPWCSDASVAGPFNDVPRDTNLWENIKGLVGVQVKQMLLIPYRRREYESTAMTFELLRRCKMVEDTNQEHGATKDAAAKVGGAKPLASQKQSHALMISNRISSGNAVPTILDALESLGFSIAEPTDAADVKPQVDAACVVLIVLSEGVLAEGSQPRSFVDAVVEANGKVVLVQLPRSKEYPSGWEFYGPDQQAAPDEIQLLLKSNEALTFRARDALEFEFDAMVSEIERRIDLATSSMPYKPVVRVGAHSETPVAQSQRRLQDDDGGGDDDDSGTLMGTFSTSTTPSPIQNTMVPRANRAWSQQGNDFDLIECQQEVDRLRAESVEKDEIIARLICELGAARDSHVN
eukprot:SAG31_NODE_2822_length_5036_cov_2.054049_2_plen_411_part_00